MRIDVRSAQRTYPVLVGAGLVSNVAALLAEQGLANPTVVTVPPVWRHHGDRLSSLWVSAGPVLMADGERAKNSQTITRLFDEFADRGVTRSDAIIAFGGGVVGDTAGFAAATYLRGLPLCRSQRPFSRRSTARLVAKSASICALGKNLGRVSFAAARALRSQPADHPAPP